MKKLVLIFLFLLSFKVFSNELDLCEQYVSDNNLLSDYSILDLQFENNNAKTYLLYKAYNNKSLSINDDILVFTDAVLIKADKNHVIQFLAIYKDGLVLTNNNIKFYDFSERGYFHIEFNGWILKYDNKIIDNIDMYVVNLQLTNDGTKIINADPSLPIILWDYPNNYPVKYEFTMYPFPNPIWLIEYEWREDINISCARTGLRDNDMTAYLDKLSDYDKRIILNAMFAIHGYEFKTNEWKNFFGKFKWYKPDKKIINDVSILDEYQNKLFLYLSNN